jgi:hypothetical protein
VLGFAIGADGMGYGLTAAVVVAAVINAATGVCLGCRLYLLARRLQRS